MNNCIWILLVQLLKTLLLLLPASCKPVTLTVDIGGYASQIQAQGRIENKLQAIDHLQTKQLFDVPTIAQFYFVTDKDGHSKAYIRMLDYLRLLILDYLRSYQSSQQKSAQIE